MWYHVGMVLGHHHLEVAHGAHGLVVAKVQPARQRLVALLVVPDQLLQDRGRGVRWLPLHQLTHTYLCQGHA